MYNLFISHSWGYSYQYENLIALLRKHGLVFRDYSVPYYNAFETYSDRELEECIYNQIRQSSCVLMVAGVYATYSKWMDIELDIAKNAFYKPKKVIAIWPYNAKRISSLGYEADYIVPWRGKAIIEAIEDEW